MLDSARFSGARLLGSSTSMLVRVHPKNRPKRTVLGQALQSSKCIIARPDRVRSFIIAFFYRFPLVLLHRFAPAALQVWLTENLTPRADEPSAVVLPLPRPLAAALPQYSPSCGKPAQPALYQRSEAMLVRAKQNPRVTSKIKSKGQVLNIRSQINFTIRLTLV